MNAVQEIPGMQHVAGTTDPEIAHDNSTSNFTVQGYAAPESENMDFESPRITPFYFATLRQALLAGREFTDADGRTAAKVAVVNLTFARRFYGSPQNALGRLIMEGASDTRKPDTTIVGVVADVRHRDLRAAPKGTVYLPYLQWDHPGGLVLYALTSQPPEFVESAIRERIHRFDPKLVADDMRTMDEQVDRSVSSERTLATLAVSFSGLAFLMTSVGLYGELAIATAQRTREIGVRMALGAQRSSVVMLVMREMALTALLAIVVALPAAFGLSRLLTSQLYGVKPGDPLTLVACIVATALMVVVSAAIPAQRAASIDPMKALRSE
jgi:predicted permease